VFNGVIVTTPMKLISALLAVLLVASPAIARGPTKVKVNKSGTKATYYRDDDRDGHYAKKGEVDLRRGYYGGSRYYNGSRYYGNRTYGRGYGNRYYGGRYYTGYRRPYHSSYSIWPWRSRSVVVTTVRRPYSQSDYGYSSIEVNVQRALSRKGYYTGPIDGDIGPGTRSAIRTYQDDQGLRVTGRIDSALLRTLRI